MGWTAKKKTNRDDTYEHGKDVEQFACLIVQIDSVAPILTMRRVLVGFWCRFSLPHNLI